MKRLISAQLLLYIILLFTTSGCDGGDKGKGKVSLASNVEASEEQLTVEKKKLLIENIVLYGSTPVNLTIYERLKDGEKNNSNEFEFCILDMLLKEYKLSRDEKVNNNIKSFIETKFRYQPISTIKEGDEEGGELRVKKIIDEILGSNKIKMNIIKSAIGIISSEKSIK
jgi:hypothetical protein